MRSLVFVVALALSLGLVMAACGDPAPTAAPAPAPKPKPAAGSLNAGASPDGGVGAFDGPAFVYSYNPIGKRDPFRAEADLPKPSGDPVGNPNCTDPLCGYDLDQVTLVGVVSGDANPVAMLEDPSHVGHIVHRNSRVGKQGGKVTSISRDCLVVTEYFQTPDGRVNPNKVNICVKKDEALDKVYDLLNNKSVQ